jgi:hypothetical protein
LIRDKSNESKVVSRFILTFFFKNNYKVFKLKINNIEQSGTVSEVYPDEKVDFIRKAK